MTLSYQDLFLSFTVSTRVKEGGGRGRESNDCHKEKEMAVITHSLSFPSTRLNSKSRVKEKERYSYFLLFSF
jgi:hypothetical protein